MDLIFDLVILAFFRHAELPICHSKLCCLISGLYLKIHNSSPVMTCLKKFSSFLMCSIRSGHTFLYLPLFSFCSLVRFFGTSFAQIFCMPNSSIKMSWMVGWFKFNSLLIILSKDNQTSWEPSLWSHFLPFLTCKVFQNEVRLKFLLRFL